MKRSFLPKLSYSNVIASIALFVALGGAAVAAGLPRNSVGPNQIKRGAVNAAKLKRNAVNSAKLAPKSVIAGKLAPNAVTPGNIGNGAVTTSKLAANAVIASTIKNNVVTTNKLNNGAVTTQKLANGAVTNPILANESVTPNKLSSDFGPVIATLKSGQTLRGSFTLGANAGTVTFGGQTFQSPLTSVPVANVIAEGGAATPACAGISGGGGQTPEAAKGQLCVYVTKATGLKELKASPESLTRLGFGLEAEANVVDTPFFATGLWAVTAP